MEALVSVCLVVLSLPEYLGLCYVAALYRVDCGVYGTHGLLKTNHLPGLPRRGGYFFGDFFEAIFPPTPRALEPRNLLPGVFFGLFT